MLAKKQPATAGRRAPRLRARAAPAQVRLLGRGDRPVSV